MNRLLANSIEKIVSKEGEKFVHLSPGFDSTTLRFNKASKPSLYIHIPFCQKLCPYCSFNRYVYNEELAIQYFQSLNKELQYYKNKGFDFQEVYFGGGTPTINLSLLTSCIEKLQSLFSIQEISVEANPSDLSEPTILQLQHSGVQRLSIGVQSFKDTLLLAMGRRSHTSQEAVSSVERALSHFQTINIDCIFNFPNQTLEDLYNDIQMVKKIGVNQATFYPLMPSPHKKSAMERRFQTIDTKREYSFYQLLQNEMKKDFQPSTCWCFSKGDQRIDEYIIHHPEYVGIGAGSVGFLQETFYVNTFHPTSYIEQVQKNQVSIVMHKKATKKEAARYFMLTQLFGMKLDAKALYNRYQNSIATELLLLQVSSIVNKRGHFYYTTEVGMYYIGLMMKHFFIGLNTLREICIQNGV
ncbi:MAG: coproporphyrinogen III oxidase family protein [Caldisericia bacterium]|nr:coproporphyrinogen III oxidase family protein [Caldisericia bacterium]MDD4613993.1 coproporphyrinogen III oxidase family protein [Caldisericia bacterium]